MLKIMLYQGFFPPVNPTQYVLQKKGAVADSCEWNLDSYGMFRRSRWSPVSFPVKDGNLSNYHGWAFPVPSADLPKCKWVRYINS